MEEIKKSSQRWKIIKKAKAPRVKKRMKSKKVS